MFELSEAQQAVQTSIRRFARRELRWRARKLDSAPAGTIDWDLLRKSCTFGLLSGQLPESSVSYDPIREWELDRVQLRKLREAGVAEELLRPCGPG